MKKLFATIMMLAIATWAHAATDIKLDLQLKKTSVEVGEALPYDLVFTNLTHRDAIVCGGSPSKGTALDYGVEITDENGKQVAPAYKTSRSGVAGSQTVPADKALTLSDLLNYWCIISKPGKYTAKAWWRPMMSPWPPFTVLPDTVDIPRSESAPVSFTVVAATPEAKDARLKAASDKLAAAKTSEDMFYALGDLGLTLDERAVQDLVKALRQSDTAGRAQSVLDRLAGADLPPLHDAVVESLLADLKKNGPNKTTTQLFGEFRIPGARLAPALQDWVDKGRPQQKSEALLALGTLDAGVLPAALRPAIVAAFSDGSPDVKRCALAALSAARYDGLLDQVIYIAKSDKDPSVRAQAALTIGAYKDDKGIPTLIQLIGSPKEEVALSAVAALETIGSSQAEGALKTFSDPSGSLVQQRASQAYLGLKAKREGPPK